MTRELGRIGQSDRLAVRQRRDEHITVVSAIQSVGIDIRMTDTVKGQRGIEKLGRVANNRGAARGIVGAGAFLPVIVTDCVGTVQRVVQTSPARVSRIDCKPWVRHRDDELRTRHLGNFAVDILGFDVKGSPSGTR